MTNVDGVNNTLYWKSLYCATNSHRFFM